MKVHIGPVPKAALPNSVTAESPNIRVIAPDLMGPQHSDICVLAGYVF
jgi:hypothetical protein